MEEIQGNNKEHFVEAFYQNRLRYRNFALRFVHNETDAEQIVDDCFLRFFEKRNQIEDRNIESYFYTSLKYGCLNHLRDQQRHCEFKKEIYNKTYRLRQYDITILDSLDSAQIFSREIHYILQRKIGCIFITESDNISTAHERHINSTYLINCLLYPLTKFSA